jgi:hypothetical protein
MTVIAPDLYPRKRPDRYTPERDAFLREHPGVDPKILADHLGVSERFVIQYQRKLGIRPMTGSTPRKK